MESSNISAIHTPCKSCVFAIYNDKTQTGCHLDYINKYKNKDTQILEAYDNDLEFFIVNDKKCVGYRENPWFAKYGLEHSSIEKKIAKVKEVNHIDYILVINFLEIGDKEEDLDNLKNTLSTLAIHPKKIVFIRGSEGTIIYATIQKLMTDSKINCKWRIQTMVDESISNENILHNAINNDKSYRFVCHIKNSKCDNLNYIVLTANDIVYDKLDQFMVLTDKDSSCVLFSAGVYRFSLAENKQDLLANPDNFQVV
jgi:hypothetical protein